MAGDDSGGGEVDGLLARPALPVDRHAGDVLRETRRQHRVACGISALLTHLGDRTPDDVVDESGIQADAAGDLLQHASGEVDRVDTAQGALLRLADADGSAYSGHDDSVIAHPPIMPRHQGGKQIRR